MDRLELARRLFGDGVEGTSTFHPAETQTYIGKAVSDSADGLVRVDIGNSTTEDGEEGIEVATTVSVKEGEEVYVTAVGGTVAKSYYVSGVVGLGDETNSRITAIETDYVKATMLEADLAEIGVLTADSAVITEIQAETAKVENVTAAQLEASTAYIGALQTGNVTAQNIIADKAKLAQIDTAQITADHAVINTLDSNYAKIDLANVSNAWIDDGVIRDAAIGDAQIADISANKLTAGTINGSVINVTNLNATNITTGTINGQRLGEGSIALSKLSESVYTEGEVDSIVSNLNDRIDSAIETYTATAVPTLSNYPASSWDTNDKKAEHVGDICYVLNAGSETDGYTYRFAYDNSTGTYQWVLIKDNQVTAALQRLVDAEGDIDGLQSFQSDTSVWISDTDEALNLIRSNHTSLTTVVNKTIVETVQLWYSKANTTAPAKPTSQVTSTSTSGGAWRTVVPSYSTSYPNYFYCYQWKYADGTYGWSSVTRDIAMGEAQSTSRTAASNAASAATTANSNIKSNVQLWYTKQTSTAPSKPSAHVTTNNAGTANAWNLAVPTYNATYPHYFYCYEYQLGDGTYGWTNVVYDSAMTESQERARTAVSNAATAQTAAEGAANAASNAQNTANKNVKTSIQLWYTKDNETAPAKPSAKVTSDSTSGGGWRTVVPSYNASYPKYFYCYQYELADGTYTWSDVVFDRATTENEANAHSALTQLTTKVDVETFNDLTDTVSEHTRNITTLTTTTQQMTQKIDNISVGGRNLLKFTGSPKLYATNISSEAAEYRRGWTTWGRLAETVLTEEGVKHTADGNGQSGIVVPLIYDGAVSGGDELVLSFDYRCNSSSWGALYLLYHSGGNASVEESSWAPTTVSETEWAHHSTNVKFAKTGSVAYGILLPYSNVSGNWFEIRNGSLKLERGNVATDWTPAVEDSPENIPNLTPYFSHDLTDVYNETGNPNGYWLNIQGGYTQLEDGWAHYERDNTSSAPRTWDYARIRPLDNIVPDGVYTALIEVRNAVVTGSTVRVSWGANDYSQFGHVSPSAIYEIPVGATDSAEFRVVLRAKELTDTMTTAGQFVVNSVDAGDSVAMDIRVSLYEGAYMGPYKPYVDQTVGTKLVTVSNTVNTVSQKADSNIQKISNLTTTLGTNADGTTNVNDIVHRESALEQDLDSFKSTVSETYATKNDLSAETTARTTAIRQTTEAIALKANSSDVYTKSATDGLISTEVTNRNAAIQTATDGIRSEVSETYATKTEVRRTDTGSGTVITSDDAANLPPISLTVHGKSVQDGTPSPSNPVEIRSVESANLSPYFSQDLTDVYSASTNPNGYWFWFSTEATWTQKDDGWVHVAYSNTGSSAVYPNCIVQQVPALKNGASYTFLVEIANAAISGDVKFSPNGSAGSTVAHLNNVTAFSIANNSTYYKSVTAKSDFSGCNRFTRSYFNVPAGGSISLDLRISIYEGGYLGPYLPCNVVEVKTSGKNLAEERIGVFVNGAAETIASTNGAQTAFCAVERNTDYTLSYDGGNRCVIAGIDSPTVYSGDTVGVIYSTSAKVSPKTFNSGEHDFIACFVATSAAPASNIQVEKGIEATAYEAYAPSITPIDLDGNALRSIGDVRDSLDVVDGRLVLTKRIGALDMGSINYTRGTLSDGNPFFYSAIIEGLDGKSPYMCSNFEWVSTIRNYITADGQLSGYNNNVSRYAFRYDSYTSNVAVKEALAGVTLYYVLLEPQTIDLGTIELPSLPSPSFSMHVDAAVSPTLDAEWWTTGGEEVGSVYQRTSALEQDAEGLSVRMRGLETDAVLKSKDEWTAWLDVGTDSGNNPFLAMGQSGNDLNSRLSNESMGFYNGTEELMKLSGAEGVKADTVRTKRVYIGSWILEELDSGDMAIKLVGGGA